MMTAGLIHYMLNLLHITVHIRDVCVFLAPVFSGLTAISTFLLTRELWNQGAGLLAACFIAIVPGYISRSVAGSFDNEGIAIFALQFTYYLWVSMPVDGWKSARSSFTSVLVWNEIDYNISSALLKLICVCVLNLPCFYLFMGWSSCSRNSWSLLHCKSFTLT